MAKAVNLSNWRVGVASDIPWPGFMLFGEMRGIYPWTPLMFGPEGLVLATVQVGGQPGGLFARAIVHVCVCCVSSSSTSDSKIRSPCQRMQPEAWYCKHSAGGGDSHGPHLGAYRGSILSGNNIVLLHVLRAIWISTTASYGFCRWFLATKPLRHRSTSTTCSMATGSASRKRGISDLLLGGRPLGDIIGSCNP